MYAQLPFYQRQGHKAFRADLHNIQALVKALDHPHQKFPTIHVAGTNGKGSSCHMLAAVLQSAGYTCGLYTSPHLWSFRERIRINGEEISEPAVLDFVNLLLPLMESIEPSFFEMTVAMAFHYFAQEKVDLAIIEVGLGGRLDSTNIIQPLISLITNISLDHQAVLGPDLPSIAREKAGIIKARTPVVISEYHPETYPVFTQFAKERASPLSPAFERYQVSMENDQQGIRVRKNGASYFNHLVPELKGSYQLKNLAGVFTVLDIIAGLGWPLEKEARKKGIENTIQLSGLRGRWEIIREKPSVICDTAHNSGALEAVFEQVNALNFNNLHIITALSKDKDIKNLLGVYPSKAFYYFCQYDSPRSLRAEELHQEANNIGLKGEIFQNVNLAYQSAIKIARDDDLLLIIGSTFVVAELDIQSIK